MATATKRKPSAAQAKVLGILKDGGRLTRVSGKFGGWVLSDKDDRNVDIRSTTAWCLMRTDLLTYDKDRSTFGVTRYKLSS